MKSLFIICLAVAAIISRAEAAPCLTVTLTGTGPGPAVFNGLAGPGTLVRYGDDGNDCSELKLQFDAGRGTTMRLSQLHIDPANLDAVGKLNWYQMTIAAMKRATAVRQPVPFFSLPT